MMNTTPETCNLDEVINAFLEEFPIPAVPSMEHISVWRKRYPMFASELIELAEGLFELSLIRGDEPIDERTEEEKELSLKKMTYLVQRGERKRTNVPSFFATLGARAKLAREALGLTMNAVATKMGLTVGEIQALENEDRSLNDSLLGKLAEVLNVSKIYLLETNCLQIVDQLPRNGHLLSPNDLKRVEIEALDFTSRYLGVEMIADASAASTTGSVVPEMSMNSVEDAELAARQLRQLWQLADKPIKSITQLLEENNVKILRTNLGKGDGFALKINEGQQVVADVIVTGKSWNVARQRFTLAHELGHLIAPQASEETIDRFAGAFLLPAEVLHSRYNGAVIGFEQLLELKYDFGVSPLASIRRLSELGFIDNVQMKALYEACDKMKGQAQREALSGFDEAPRRFRALCLKALDCKSITTTRAAELLNTSLIGLKRMQTA